MPYCGYICEQCCKSPGMNSPYSAQNDMDPFVRFDHLKLPKLNDIEQMLIAKVQPYMRIIWLEGGGVGYKGSILNVEQDISEICSVLPNFPEDIPVFLLENLFEVQQVDTKTTE